MGTFFLLIFYSCLFTLHISIAAKTLTQSESIADGQTLSSSGDQFQLGFFSPSNSNNRYLGIWYKRIPVQTVVWVANRDSPLNDTSGVLRIASAGNIFIVNKTQAIIWASNSSQAAQNPVLELLDTGNLVLRNGNDGVSESYLWQSFDYPGDTLLPNMKLGWNLTNGMNRYLSSWKNSDDPSHGGFTYGMDISGYLETAIRNGSKKYYRGGPWNGVSHSGAPDLKQNSIFTYQMINTKEEIYFIYQLVNQSVIMRFVLTQTATDAHLQRYTWIDKTKNWVLLVSIPRDRCDDYALCGVYGTCNAMNVAVCQCLKGFKPNSPEDWSGTDWSEGCQRETALNCSSGGDGFIKHTGLKLPETVGARVNASMNLAECRISCLKNCTCMAYANSDIRRGGSGCILWFRDLVDIRELSDGGEDLYIRMAASELDSKASGGRMKPVLLIAIITLVAGLIILGIGGWWFWKKRRPQAFSILRSVGISRRENLELPLYDLDVLINATDNFSNKNKLGEGGFGPVYKGMLEGDQTIAVKRLSKDSIQGIDEFKNEVILISKLQHRNLVRLLGCCIEEDEKMLIYEYMPNKSLDASIFDKTNSRLLDWEMRFQIILGIARGLLYLHHDSRLRIIHRDLKASNVLLDDEMVPKISDFGMARLFGGDQLEAKTKRVVGTYGYMAPEYAIDGYFSMKSDVFSFGVLILEIISGKKNRSFCHPDHELNLLGHAWRLWLADRSGELVDETIRNDCVVEDVLRCIHIGLLCVQRGRDRRPTMPSVVLMLSTETTSLPKPQEPGFYMERSTMSPSDAEDATHKNRDLYISSDLSMTRLEAR